MDKYVIVYLEYEAEDNKYFGPYLHSVYDSKINAEKELEKIDEYLNKYYIIYFKNSKIENKQIINEINKITSSFYEDFEIDSHLKKIIEAN